MEIVTKVFDGEPRWISVVPKVEGKLPKYSDETKGSWLRLDLVEGVEAVVCIGIGEDTSNYEYGVAVYALGRSYYVSRKIFKGATARDIVEEVLHAVSASRRDRK